MLERLRLGDNIPVAETLKLLSTAPPLLVLKLLNADTGGNLDTLIGNVSTELDFVQTVADLVSSGDGLNPSLNAVADAFRRRLLKGRFVSESNTVKMNALVYTDTKGANDNDVAAKDVKDHYSTKKYDTTNRGKAAKGICFLFQRGLCRWIECRFEHRCSLCKRLGHGEVNCMKKAESSRDSFADQNRDGRLKRGKSAERPPHPRFRRDRR